MSKPNDFALVTQVYDAETDKYVDVDKCQYVIWSYGDMGQEICQEPAVPGEAGCEAHLPWM